MIRTSKHILKFANKNKLDMLEQIYSDCKKQIEVYIDQIVSDKLELKKMMSSKLLSNEYIEQSKWKQMCYEQTSEIIRSQYKKASNKRFNVYKKIYAKLKEQNRYNKFISKKFSELNLKPIQTTKYLTKPKLNNISIIIHPELLNFTSDSNNFDSFVRLTAPYKKKTNKIRNHYQTINLPIKYHSQSNKFRTSGWKLKNSISLIKVNNNFYFDLFWEKEEVVKKVKGKQIGLDCGYKKLLISSDNKIYDLGLEKIYEKLSRKKQGSKNFKQALTERDNLINQSINKLETEEIKIIVVEDLKNVKAGSKFSKKFNNKLQRWSYPKVLNKLSMICEEQGINLVRVDPAYTSQTCSGCGFKDKDNRKAEKFLCLGCGYETDSDYNASVNILHRGIYSSSTENNKANLKVS